jgi:dCTP deaminase
VVVNVTPLEPEWEGHVTISVCNTASAPVKLYANEGIAQLVFLAAGEPCQTSYADRSGKYQAHKDITHSRT